MPYCSLGQCGWDTDLVFSWLHGCSRAGDRVQCHKQTFVLFPSKYSVVFFINLQKFR